MTILLASGPLSVSELIDAIRIQSRDADSNPVFSDDEIKLALRQAVLNSHGMFFTSTSTTLSFTSGTFEYTLDDDVSRIVLITRNPTLVTNATSSLPDIDITSYRHFDFGRNNNTLVFLRDYPDTTMNIYYERDVPVPIDARTLGAAISTTSATSMTLTDAEPELWRLSLPVYAKIDDEIVKITAISGNTTATISRGEFDTTAATHTANTEVSQIVNADSDRFYNFLMMETGRILNRNRVQSGSGNIDVAANLTAANMFKEDVEAMGEKHRQPRRPRKMRFVRSQRRPRRRYL